MHSKCFLQTIFMVHRNKAEAYLCAVPGGGVLSPFDGGGVLPEKKYRGVRELLFIPKKGGVRELE